MYIKQWMRISKNYDKAFMVWLQLISLTLLSMFVAESESPSSSAILVVCGIVVAKGRWVIHYFMGLKNAAPIARWIVSFYFYLMTFVVGLTFTYSQSLIVH